MTHPDSKRHLVSVVTVGAALMVATLPGRSQGLGLITEPLLTDLAVSRHAYAQINLWATLLGAFACLPAGAWVDRFGARRSALVILLALAAVVGAMSLQSASPSVVSVLFVWMLLSRALGQGALSVTSIRVAGAAFKPGQGGAAAAYAVALSIGFMVAFGILGWVIRESGWRVAWQGLAVGLLLLLPMLYWLPLARSSSVAEANEVRANEGGRRLGECLRQPLFWIYTVGIALFSAVQAGIGLFNEALLAERGFDQKTYHWFLAGTALIALIGQGIAGVGPRWLPLRLWLGMALIIQALVLAAFSQVESITGLYVLAAAMGISAGVITVAFFAIWGETFGQLSLGRVLGVAQMASVFASACGPLLLERGAFCLGGYAAALLAVAPVSLVLGCLCWMFKPSSP